MTENTIETPAESVGIIESSSAESAGVTEDASSESSKKKEFIRAVKFLLFSMSAGLIQMGSFALLNELLHLPYWLSYLIALVLSVLWNFTLNRKFTFKSATNVPIAMLKVAAYYLVFSPLSSWLEDVYTMQWGWNEYLATFVNMFLNLVTEFLFQRFFVFGDSLDTQETSKGSTEEPVSKPE